MTNQPIKLLADASPFTDFVAGLDFADLSEIFLEVLERLFNLPDFFEKLFAFKSDFGPAGTGELLVSLEPTDLFVRLSSAIAAGDIEAVIFEHDKYLGNGGDEKA